MLGTALSGILIPVEALSPLGLEEAARTYTTPEVIARLSAGTAPAGS